ncbi:MAG TPA: hypothetical protein VE981_19980 [Planctomycetota bacterium]|nr:hypothetical protein [Planctomycetota bacterium]
MRVSISLMVLALLSGCGSKEAPAGTVPAASGGVVGDPAGAQLVIPPGALPKDAAIALTSSPPESHPGPGVRVIGPVWNFKVDGAEHFSFLKPVQIALPYDAAVLDPARSPGLSVWSGTQWDKVPGSRVDAAKGKIVAEVDHFSTYAPTQNPVEEAIDRSLEGQRKRWFNNQFWYGEILVTIHGSGRRKHENYSIQRDAQVRFRIPAMPGEAAMDSMMEQMKKSPVALPPKALQSLQDARNRRHWITQLTNKQPEDETDAHLDVHDAFNSVGGKVETDGSVWSRQSNEGGLDRKVMGIHQLEIDIVKGTYSYQGGQINGPKVVYSSSNNEKPEPKILDLLARLEVHLKDEKLPDSGTTISGLKSIPKGMLASVVGEIGGNWSYSYGRTSGTIAWTFSPVPFDDVELVMVPKGYDAWLPRGGPDEGTKGNSLPLQVRLQKHGGGPTKARMTSLTVRIDDVSREPGVCLNLPATKGADTPDLRFATGAGYTLEDDGTRVVHKGSPIDKLDLVLDCFDWGAWGAVKSQAVLEDGRMVFGVMEGNPAEDEVRVPKRPPESFIADKWKTDQGIEEGRPDLDDKDPQKGNPNDGDGLTLYEEYRGMMAKGKHTRDHGAGPDGIKPLTPGHKDLILDNRIGSDAAVVAGLLLFEKASGIHLVEVDPAELPQSREVNVNRGPRTSVRAQHGLVLVDVRLPGDDTGLTKRDYHKPLNSREAYDRVQVDLVKIRTILQGDKGATWSAATEISQTVAHEITHALDVNHHGPNGIVNLQNPAALKIYDRSKTRVTPNPVPGVVGYPKNEASGDVHCIMCYNAMYAWAYHAPDYLFLGNITPPGTLFCTSVDGTGHNAPFDIPDPANPARKIRISGVFGPAAEGPCLPMMRVKDQN